MVRAALFSILGNAVPNRIFFDVYAGTGVVGLEAISRGASRATFIERDAKQATLIQKYADQFHVADKTQIIRADANRWAERWVPPFGGPVNIFLSPPFPDLHPEKVDAFLKIVWELNAKMPPESVLVLQVEDTFPMETLGDLTEWDIRDYGRNILMIRVKEESVSTSSSTSQAAESDSST